MDTIFMNSKNSEASDPHKLLLSLTDKIHLKRSDQYVALLNLSIYCTWENVKGYTKIINLKYPLSHGMKNLNYMMDHILYLILKIS